MVSAEGRRHQQQPQNEFFWFARARAALLGSLTIVNARWSGEISGRGEKELKVSEEKRRKRKQSVADEEEMVRIHVMDAHISGGIDK